MQTEHPPTDRRRLSPLKIVAYAGFGVAAIVLVCVLVLLLFPDPLLNGFIKPRLTKAFAESYPAYSLRIAHMKYSVATNRLGFDSVALRAVDGTFSGTMGGFSVSGIGWMHLLWGGRLAPFDFANSVVVAQDIAANFPKSQYELRCGMLRVSVADSEMVADALTLRPAVDDRQFFAQSTFRKTRLNLTTQHCKLTGVAVLEALDRKDYRARRVQILDMCLDILINKDKPANTDTVSPPMPNELLSSMKETIRCDSTGIINGTLKYAETFGVRPKPAMIRFDSLQVGVEGFATRGGASDTVVIRMQGEFMNSGKTKIFMSIPVSSSEFSFRNSGSLHSMDLRALNSFLEIAEQQRVTSGTLESATFDFNVVAGRASGSVRAVYRDLTLAAINKHTGSEKGFLDGIASYLAKTYKIRGTNVPDKSGSMKIGQVKYIHLREDPFFRFWWFALRSGVGDVVGF